MHGYGTHTYPDGSVFTGTFVKGLKEGEGHIVFKDQSSYHGDFKNDMMHVETF